MLYEVITDWSRLIYVFVMGLFIGLVLAPEIEPKAFKKPWLFQILGGAIFGIILAIRITSYNVCYTKLLRSRLE